MSSREARLRDAAIALSRGDALAALSVVGRTDDVGALLLKGIAYAQLGDLDLARKTLDAVDREGANVLVRARVRAALAEVALGEGDARRAGEEARRAADALEALGDARNAAMQQLVVARADVLLGRLGDARRRIDELLAGALDRDVRGVALLASAEIAARELSATDAVRRLASAAEVARESSNALLVRTLAAFESDLRRPIARLVSGGVERAADLFAVEESARGDVLLVDACRKLVVAGRATVRLAKKPALFSILRVLARAWPNDRPRDELVRAAFDVKRANESHRARLRVEIGRLRKELAGIAEPVATRSGYVLETKRPVRVLLPPTDDADAAVAMLLEDGAAWTAQEIAEHAHVSKRTALRALASLVERGRARRLVDGKVVRYATTSERPAIASRLLLLGLASES